MIQSAARITSKVVLDHQQRVTGDQQLAERLQQLGHVLEVQSGGRLIEQKQLAAVSGAREHRAGLRQVPGELQSLRLAAREGGHGLAELQVLEAHVGERRESRRHLGCVGRRTRALASREIQHVGDCLQRRPSAPSRRMSRTSSR